MRHVKKWLLSATIISLTCSPAYSQTTANSTPAADALRVLPGWTAPAKGYYLTDAAMRDTITGWTTAKQQAEIRQQALEALRDEIAAQTQQMKLELANLQHEITQERKIWRIRVRRGKGQGLVYGLLLGGVAGYVAHKNR